MAWYALDAYSAYGRPIDGWSEVTIDIEKQATDAGFFARTYTDGTHVVIAFRGTNELRDTLTDLALGERFDPQFLAALQYTQAVREKFKGQNVQIVVTGHSLGGALAQLAADAFNLGGWAFDDPSAMGLIGRQELLDYLNTLEGDPKPTLDGKAPDLHHTLVSGSPISFGPKIGMTPEVIENGDAGIAGIGLGGLIATGLSPALGLSFALGSFVLARHSMQTLFNYCHMLYGDHQLLTQYAQGLALKVNGFNPEDSGIGNFGSWIANQIGSATVTTAQVEVQISLLKKELEQLTLKGDTPAMADCEQAIDILSQSIQSISSTSGTTVDISANGPGPHDATIQLTLSHSLIAGSQIIKVILPTGSHDPHTGELHGFSLSVGLDTLKVLLGAARPMDQHNDTGYAGAGNDFISGGAGDEHLFCHLKNDGDCLRSTAD